MRSLQRYAAIASILFIAGSGCGGDGDSTDQGGDLARVEGRVTRVVDGSGIASGVGPTELDGIRVEARESGRSLAFDTTDAAGNFELEFAGAGEIELIFLTDDYALSLVLVVFPGSVVRLEVELRPLEDEVIVVDGEDGPLRCETDSLVIGDDDLDLVIDGRGEDCLRVAGNCEVEIVARSVTLTGCESCIRAGGNSNVVIATADSFVCEARDVGLRAEGTATVAVDTFDDVIVTAGEQGIQAVGNSQIILGADDTCSIAGPQPLDVRGNAAVDTAGCAGLELIGD